MASKRGMGRARKRMMVRYGVDKADKTAFTINLSETGVNLKTNTVYKPGTTVQVELKFTDRTFSMWARVIWAKKVPPQLAHVLECGMGLCFVDPTPEWLEYFEAWSKGQPGIEEG